MADLHATLCKIPIPDIGRGFEHAVREKAAGMLKGICPILKVAYTPFEDKPPPFSVFGHVTGHRHYVAIVPATSSDGGVLIEPALEKVLALAEPNMGIICGGEGEYNGFDYFYGFCTEAEYCDYLKELMAASQAKYVSDALKCGPRVD